MLRAFPHGEDFKGTAGGDSDVLQHGKGRPVTFAAGPALGNSPASPPGEGKNFNAAKGRRSYSGGDNLGAATSSDDQIENYAQTTGLPDEGKPEEVDIDFLQLVREAEQQSNLYMAQVNRKAWAQSYRAFHQEHFAGSKYTRPDWRNRSKFFRPKTRSGVRKDQAAVAASLFGSVDAIKCMPGDESNPLQRGAAAVMQELINYRTDRTSGKAAIPWFQVCMGSRQDALLTGICLSKQSWKLELKKSDEQERSLEPTEEDPNVYQESMADVYVPEIDRPEAQLIPPENFVIDPSAEWTDPVQSAAYIMIKWPMQIEDIREKQKSPLNPWKQIDESLLRTAGAASEVTITAIRRAREMGLDRLDETQTGTHYQIVWVYEVFIKYGGVDWTFFSISDRAFLTDPKPTKEVYPEQAGMRPLVMGFGSLESHRIFPMSPVESWQMLQLELNDLANLTLDAIKQNVMPVSKVKRGRAIDLDQVKRRAHGSSILVQDKDDVTWDRPPDIPQSVPVLTRELELELDDLAGQFNSQTAENSNSLSRTLGGLKLVAGASNAVQEFDIRVWIETWVEPVLAQLVHLEQYYESDPIVLGLAGQRAQLFQKHGISQIDDRLLEEEVTMRVSAGLGAGDPAQRLQKFQMAVQIAAPLLSQSPEFQRGEVEMNWEAVTEEIFGAAGYRDGGKRFFKQGQPKPNPLGDLPAQKIQSEIEKNKATAKSSLLTGLAAVAKAQLGDQQLEADNANALLDAHLRAAEMGHDHGTAHHEALSSAREAGHKHGIAMAEHRLAQAEHEHQKQIDHRQADAAEMQGAIQASQPKPAAASGAGGGAKPAPQPKQPTRYEFTRDPKTNRITGAIPIYGEEAPGGMPVNP